MAVYKPPCHTLIFLFKALFGFITPPRPGVPKGRFIFGSGCLEPATWAGLRSCRRLAHGFLLSSPPTEPSPVHDPPALVLPDVSRCWAPTGASPLVGSQALPPAARFPSTLNSSNEGCLGCRAPTKCKIRPSPSPMGHRGTPPRYTLPSLEGSAGSANARALVHSSTAEQLPAGALGLVCNAEAQYQRTGQATRARERAGLTPVPAQALWS